VDRIAVQSTEGTVSLEVRWIFPGRLPAAMTEWFDRFPASTESQQDTYLLDPHLPGLSVKIRGGTAFEVKAYLGSPGILNAGRRARGRLESWQKWSFPVASPGAATIAPPGTASGGRADWVLVRKQRRISRFPLAGGQAHAVAALPGEAPGCAVELTEARLREEAWWTLGFETIGPTSLLHHHLEATAALVFGLAVPDGIALGTGNSASYVEWLHSLPGSLPAGGRR
jgi:hypothetical protein